MNEAKRFARNEAMVSAALRATTFDGSLDEKIVISHGIEPGVLELALRRAEATILVCQHEEDPNKYQILIRFPDCSFIIGARDDGATPQTLEWSLGNKQDLERLFAS
jgi:hypothetical protein